MKPTRDEKIAALLGSIIGRISKFDKECAEKSFTDSGDTWTLLEIIKRDARRVLRELQK